MKNPRILYALAATVLVSAAALAGAAIFMPRAEAPLDQGTFPSQLSVRAEVHEGEVVRTVELYPNGTPRFGEAENADKSVTKFWYREDGTLAKAVTESAPDEQGKRTQLRYAEVGADGKTYVYDVEYNAAGDKLKETRLVDANTTERTYFFPVGDTRRTQVIALDTRGWKLVTEDVFREDRTLVHTLRSGEAGSWEENDFADDGKTVVGLRRLRKHSVDYVDWQFDATGVTKLREVMQTNSRTTVTIRRPDDGSISEVREWTGEVEKSSMLVYIYDRAGNRMYDQWWDMKEGKYVLWMVREYRPDGTQSRQLLHDKNGGFIVAELVYSGDGMGGNNSTFLRRKYRADGTLETEEDVVASKVAALREFTPADNRRIEVAPEHLAFSAYTAPPQVVPYSPPGPP